MIHLWRLLSFFFRSRLLRALESKQHTNIQQEPLLGFNRIEINLNHSIPTHIETLSFFQFRISNQVRTSSHKKMGHCSRSTLPSSNYMHLWDVNRDIDVSTIKGNVSEDLKRLGQTAWDFFVSTEDKSFGANIGKRLKFAEMNIWRENGSSYAETIGFVTIDKGKLKFNQFIHMHI